MMTTPESSKELTPEASANLGAIYDVLSTSRRRESQITAKPVAFPNWNNVALRWHNRGFNAAETGDWINRAQCFHAEPAAQLRDAGVTPEQAAALTTEGRGREEKIGYKFFKGQISLKKAVELALAVPVAAVGNGSGLADALTVFVAKGASAAAEFDDLPVGIVYERKEAVAKRVAADAAPGLAAGTVYTVSIPAPRLAYWHVNTDRQSDVIQAMIEKSPVLAAARDVAVQQAGGKYTPTMKELFEEVAIGCAEVRQGKEQAQPQAQDYAFARKRFVEAGIAAYTAELNRDGEDWNLDAILDPAAMTVVQVNGKEVSPEEAIAIRDALAGEVEAIMAVAAPAADRELTPQEEGRLDSYLMEGVSEVDAQLEGPTL